jgi:ATP-dependent Lhr-like helicase
VLRQELDVKRLHETLTAMQAKPLTIVPIKRPTPFAFPLLVERFRESSSSEKLSDRIARMVADLEKAAGPGGYQPPENDDECTVFDTPPPAPEGGRATTGAR